MFMLLMSWAHASHPCSCSLGVGFWLSRSRLYFFGFFLEVFFLEDFLGPFQGIILVPSLIIINSALNIVYIIKSFFKSQQL